MAQKVNIVLIDDLDQSPADETVRFGLDGKEYSIDLSASNAQALRDSLAPYVAHGTRASGGAAAGARRSRRGSTSRGSAHAMREWARENGFEVSERGRVSEEVRSAYTAAH